MAKYNYITDKDIVSQIRADLLNQITDQDESVIMVAELTAIGQMKSKMNDRYNVSSIFIALPDEWNNQSSYTADDLVFHNDDFWKALSTHTNEEPQTGSAYWVKSDPRDPLAVNYCRDITLWHIHARINPRRIPEIREDRYAGAMAWLDAIHDGDESPDLPLKEDGTNEIRWGSNEKRDYYF